jgi:hypothetical protein
MLGGFLLWVLLKRLVRTARGHLGMKRYVRQATRLDRKQYNGLQLLEKIKRRRKRKTNHFRGLRWLARRPVRRYFQHKSEELPVFVRYTSGKLLKRSKAKLRIVVKQGSKTVAKYKLKAGAREFIDLSNDHHCLNELIIFLHHLPDAILERRDYDIDVTSANLTITYQIK